MLYFDPPLFVVDSESETAESHYGVIYFPHFTRYYEMCCFGVEVEKRHENIFDTSIVQIQNQGDYINMNL